MSRLEIYLSVGYRKMPESFRSNLYQFNTDIIQNFNYGVVHCEWNDWVIGECDKECGGGMRTNTRTEKVSAEHGGEECPGPASVDESCNVHECPGYKMLRTIPDYNKTFSICNNKLHFNLIKIFQSIANGVSLW